MPLPTALWEAVLSRKPANARALACATVTLRATMNKGNTRMRTRTTAGAVTAVALATVRAAASGASAEPNPPRCPKGYFCAYSGPNQTGTLLLRVEGNWSGNLGVGSIFNNGVVHPGADHVDVTSYWAGSRRRTASTTTRPRAGTRPTPSRTHHHPCRLAG
ncbi:peptidase inhibitor family I36 protein [Streptomyces pseudogriseolus]|uniref:peptidase inhibitor family I36 protein n=1 Tax=Streptomyces pseudogriseolus TaxID=36817 RepID=UPI003FA1A969